MYEGTDILVASLVAVFVVYFGGIISIFCVPRKWAVFLSPLNKYGLLCASIAFISLLLSYLLLIVENELQLNFPSNSVDLGWIRYSTWISAYVSLGIWLGRMVALFDISTVVVFVLTLLFQLLLHAISLESRQSSGWILFGISISFLPLSLLLFYFYSDAIFRLERMKIVAIFIYMISFVMVSLSALNHHTENSADTQPIFLISDTLLMLVPFLCIDYTSSKIPEIETPIVSVDVDSDCITPSDIPPMGSHSTAKDTTTPIVDSEQTTPTVSTSVNISKHPSFVLQEAPDMKRSDTEQHQGFPASQRESITLLGVSIPIAEVPDEGSWSESCRESPVSDSRDHISQEKHLSNESGLQNPQQKIEEESIPTTVSNLVPSMVIYVDVSEDILPHTNIPDSPIDVSDSLNELSRDESVGTVSIESSLLEEQTPRRRFISDALKLIREHKEADDDDVVPSLAVSIGDVTPNIGTPFLGTPSERERAKATDFISPLQEKVFAVGEMAHGCSPTTPTLQSSCVDVLLHLDPAVSSADSTDLSSPPPGMSVDSLILHETVPAQALDRNCLDLDNLPELKNRPIIDVDESVASNSLGQDSNILTTLDSLDDHPSVSIHRIQGAEDGYYSTDEENVEELHLKVGAPLRGNKAFPPNLPSKRVTISIDSDETLTPPPALVTKNMSIRFVADSPSVDKGNAKNNVSPLRARSSSRSRLTSPSMNVNGINRTSQRTSPSRIPIPRAALIGSLSRARQMSPRREPLSYAHNVIGTGSEGLNDSSIVEMRTHTRTLQTGGKLTISLANISRSLIPSARSSDSEKKHRVLDIDASMSATSSTQASCSIDSQQVNVDDRTDCASIEAPKALEAVRSDSTGVLPPIETPRSPKSQNSRSSSPRTPSDRSRRSKLDGNSVSIDSDHSGVISDFDSYNRAGIVSGSQIPDSLLSDVADITLGDNIDISDPQVISPHRNDVERERKVGRSGSRMQKSTLERLSTPNPQKSRPKDSVLGTVTEPNGLPTVSLLLNARDSTANVSTPGRSPPRGDSSPRAFDYSTRAHAQSHAHTLTNTVNSAFGPYNGRRITPRGEGTGGAVFGPGQNPARLPPEMAYSHNARQLALLKRMPAAVRAVAKANIERSTAALQEGARSGSPRGYKADTHKVRMYTAVDDDGSLVTERRVSVGPTAVFGFLDVSTRNGGDVARVDSRLMDSKFVHM